MMAELDQAKMAYVYKNLPARMPRGSVEVWIRMAMYPLLYMGLSRDEAEGLAVEMARELSMCVEDLSLVYPDDVGKTILPAKRKQPQTTYD